MEQMADAAHTIFSIINKIPDQTDKWRRLFLEFHEFTTKCPLVAICMILGKYNKNAFNKFLEKFADRQDELTLEEHSEYAKFLFMETNKHYTMQQCQEFVKNAREMLEAVLNANQVNQEELASNLEEERDEILNLWNIMN